MFKCHYKIHCVNAFKPNNYIPSSFYSPINWLEMEKSKDTFGQNSTLTEFLGVKQTIENEY